MSPPKPLIAKGYKNCKQTPATIRFFSGFYLNKQQDKNNNDAVDLTDPKIARKLVPHVVSLKPVEMNSKRVFTICLVLRPMLLN